MDSSVKSTNFLLNSLSNSVRDNLVGLAYTNPNVQIAENIDAIIRKDVQTLRQNGSVLLVSGGGAGHEPMFAGFVGPHMLSAAVSGSYFASPSAGQIIKLVEEIATKETPVLLILANYTGDRLNFGLAKEYLSMKGYSKIGLFVFADDLAPFLTEDKNQNLKHKRRGLAGIAFIHKIAGVLSEQGKSLEEIQNSLDLFSKLIYTISISLSAADIPGHGASFSLKANCMELGLGVHGESGIKRIDLLSAKDTIDLMLSELVNYLNEEGLLKSYNNKVALIVNNLGGLTQIEFNVILKEVAEQMSSKNISIERIYWGYFMTSFNMKGVSLSVMLVNDHIVDILDQANQGRTTSNTINNSLIYKFNSTNASQNLDSNDSEQLFKYCDPNIYRQILVNACTTIIKHEHKLNKLDETVGDSDCGSTLRSIAELFLDKIQLTTQQTNKGTDYPPTFATLARIVSDDIGGSSGALYSLLFTAACNFIRMDSLGRHHSTEKWTRDKMVQFWLDLMQHCIAKITTYSGAKPNDRSMIDGLHGIVLGLQQCLQLANLSTTPVSDIVHLVANSTWTQANKTASMKARVGRAAYVNEAYVTNPDAGAIAVAIWVQAVADTLAQNF